MSSNNPSTSSNSYRSILKSSSLLGGSSIINILIGMVRIKFVAVLLGPSGVGLIAIYGSITDIMGRLAGMGISTSGVRQIAKSFAQGDEMVVARTVNTLRRTVWITGLLGTLGMVLFAGPISELTFDSGKEAFNLALLGSTILLGSVATGQGCLLQGTRRIKELAWVSIIGAFNGTIISIPCYYFWGHQGIVPSLILCAVAGLATSWWFARRIQVKSVVMPWRESAGEAGLLLRFGFPVMLSGLMAGVNLYLINMILVRVVGLDGVGVYQAAFSLSGTLAGFVLSSMGADYYPRLTAVSEDVDKLRDMINCQTEIALLVATPALTVTLIFAPLAIALFYTESFQGSVDILRWAVFGIFGRMISWPIGFLTLAKGYGTLYLAFETLANILHVGLIWLCIQYWGLPGTGIAFVLLYVLYTVMMYRWARTQLNLKLWTKDIFLLVAGLGGMLVLTDLTVVWIQGDLLRWTASLSACAIVSVYCLRRLSAQTGISWQMLKARIMGRNNAV